MNVFARALRPARPDTVAPVPDHVERAKAAAIERSGWGLRFDAFQPRNAAFWVFWVLVLAGAWTAFGQSRTVAAPIAPTIAVGGFVLALYGALFWWVTRTMDRYSTLPAALVVHAFVWGGFAAPFFFALPANDAIIDLYGKVFGQSWVASWAPGLTAPFTEELAKGIGLVLLITLARRIVRTAFDAFILGAFLGLGFQVLEDLLYVAQTAGGDFGTDPWGAGLRILVLRMTTGAVGHIAYSAIFATGLLLLIGTPAQPRRIGRGILLVLTAMVLHGLFDSVGGFAGPHAGLVFPILLLVTAIALVCVLLVFHATVRNERDDMRAVLAPEVASGVLAPDELDAVSGDGRARRRFVAAGGRRRRGLRRALLQAVRELADDAVRPDRAAELEHARAEVARIRARSHR